MSTEDIKLSVKAANLPLYRAFFVGTFTVCSCIIGSAVYIKTSFATHDIRLQNLENKVSKIEDKLFFAKK